MAGCAGQVRAPLYCTPAPLGDWSTKDVIADTALGNPDKVVVVGAHLDGPCDTANNLTTTLFRKQAFAGSVHPRRGQ
jgi:hypothetical protein